MAAEQVTISVDEANRRHFADIVRACEREGLQVEQALEGLGVIAGRIDAARIGQLERVPGVAAVEGARQVRIPPPESELQ